MGGGVTAQLEFGTCARYEMLVAPTRSPITIYLLSGLPPPFGGVNIWTRWFMQQAPAWGITTRFERIGATQLAHTLRLDRRFLRLGRGFFKPLWNMQRGAAREHDILHICVSGGPSFWRGLVLVAIRTAQGQPSILHLHSRTKACHKMALFGANLLGHSSHVQWITPSHVDAATHSQLQGLQHFVPTEFGAGCSWQGPRDGPLKLIYVGNMLQEKGIFDLLESLRLAPAVQVDFFGSNVQPRDLRRWRSRVQSYALDRRVIYRGLLQHDQVAGAMCAYDALVFPSQDESFALVCAEAMHLGVPVISRPSGFLQTAPADIFICLQGQNPGRDGRVLLALQNDKSRLQGCGALGQAYVRRRFNVDSIMNEWRHVYEACLH